MSKLKPREMWINGGMGAQDCRHGWPVNVCHEFLWIDLFFSVCVFVLRGYRLLDFQNSTPMFFFFVCA
jgi:hypothetical protein